MKGVFILHLGFISKQIRNKRANNHVHSTEIELNKFFILETSSNKHNNTIMNSNVNSLLLTEPKMIKTKEKEVLIKSSNTSSSSIQTGFDGSAFSC